MLFERVGYEATTVDDIRRAAGVSRATFYFYFRDKRHLFLEVARVQVDETYDFYHRRYADADEYQRIVLPHIVYFEIWARRARVMAQIFSLSIDDPDFAELRRNARGRLAEMMEPRLRRLTETGRLRASPTALALLPAALDALLEGFGNRAFLERSEFEPASSFPDLVRATAEYWHRLLYGRAAPYELSDEQIESYRAEVASELDERAPITSAAHLSQR
jgi:AcrR family transcriptional regulator